MVLDCPVGVLWKSSTGPSVIMLLPERVGIGRPISGLYPIYCGVPQGSILGPLLFLLHFIDAVETLLHYGIVMYADDTVIFCADKNIDVIQKRVEEDFSSLTNRLAENDLVINCKKGKTEVMMFGTS